MMEEEFHLTGNEEDASYIYSVKMNGYKFSKVIIVCFEEEYDTYKEIYWFRHYYFAVGKRIPKIDINDADITQEFVKEFKCDLDNEDYYRVCTIEHKPIKHNDKLVELEEPNDTLLKLSNQLYDKYLIFYRESIEDE